MQLHGSAEVAGEKKEEETITCDWQRSNFRDTSSQVSAKSVMTQAQITCKLQIQPDSPESQNGISSSSAGEAMGQELPAAHPSMGPVRQGAGTCREGYTWLQERR